MPLPPSDPLDDELQTLRSRIGALTAANDKLQQRLELGDQARTDLMAQVEHMLELMARLQREVEYLRTKNAGPG